MARISAGSTLVQQYAPPFVVSDSVANNWMLRWNSSLAAFEAYDPSENVVSAGFSSIDSQIFTSVSSQTSFVVPWVADSEASLFVALNGVKQDTTTYTIVKNTSSNTTTINLSNSVSGTVEILGLQTTGGAYVQLFDAVGDGATVAYTLQWLVPSVQSLIVTVDGVKLNTNQYTIAPDTTFTTTTLTLATAPALNANIEVIGITTTGETPSSPVDAANLGSGAVEGLYSTKTLAGERQVLNFKSLAAGSGITLTSASDYVTIASAISFENVGAGQQIAVSTASTNPLQLRSIEGDTNRITVSVGGAGNTIVVTHEQGYASTGLAAYNASAGDRVIGVTNTGSAVTVTLSAIANLPAGDFVIVKDESGGAATNNITVQGSGGELIDGAATYVISTNYGFVLLYSNGTNFFVASKG